MQYETKTQKLIDTNELSLHGADLLLACQSVSDIYLGHQKLFLFAIWTKLLSTC